MQKPIISVAPMMDWTDRHCRYFLRQMSRHTVMYTEMLTTGAILKGDRNYLLAYHAKEQPLAIQLGGSDPKALAESAMIAQAYGFSEVNLNVGCPSDRVQQGKIGACLMGESDLVAECVSSMQASVTIPVTVKTRIGIDNLDSYAHLVKFIETVSDAGCKHFIIHARKAWLKGLSPKENREVPPLRYDVVQHIKQDFPDLCIILNGGIVDSCAIEQHLKLFDGVMIGRAAYHNPFLLHHIDTAYFSNCEPTSTREEVIDKMLPYIENELSKGTKLNHITRHMLGLFHGIKGGRLWRRYLSEHASKKGADTRVLLAALDAMQVDEDQQKKVCNC